MRYILLVMLLGISIVTNAQMGYWCDSTWIELTPIGEKCYVEKNGADSSRVKEYVSRKDVDNMNIAYCANLRIASSGDSVFVLPEIILKPRYGCSLNSILARIPEKMSIKSETPTGIYTFVYPFKTDVEVLETVGKLSQFEEVEWCEPNMLIQINFLNPYYAQQYYLKNTGQNGGTAGIDINVESAWQIVTVNPNIKVAVIDTGIEKNHEDLTSNVFDGYTVGDVNGKGAPITSTSDYGHGTACAGIIGAKNNSIGIRGIASGVKLLPVNISPAFETFNNMDSIANAIRWAYSRADVLSCSWHSIQTNSITTAINEATSLGRNGKGCIVVFAAGNNGGNVNYPANLSNVLAVGAVNNQGTVWDYSSRGPELDLVAPSGKLLNNSSSNSDIVTTDMSGSNGYVSGNYFLNFGGTSAACPQVAGVAALMLSINPSLPESRARSILKNTATSLGSANDYGDGLVNAGAAVLQAKNEKPPYTTHKTYISENEVICSISAPSYYTLEWTIQSGNMTNIVSGYPLSNQCTVTKSTSGVPTGMIKCQVKYGSAVIATQYINISISTTATFRQEACTFYGVGHPAIPTTTITSGGEAKFVHQGCRVYFYNEALCFHNASYTGMTPDDWYVTNDHIEFELPYGSGGIPFVVNLKDSYGNLKYYYTFFTYSNNGKALSIDPINTSSYNVSLNFDKTENNGNERPFVNADWLLEVYNTQKALKVYSATVLGNKTTIDTSGWEQGSYIIRAVVGEEVYTEKLMIK